jgi:hypothetical protein
MLQVRARLDSFGGRFSGSDPEIMVGVGVNTNVRLEVRLDVCDSVAFDC